MFRLRYGVRAPHAVGYDEFEKWYGGMTVRSKHNVAKHFEPPRSWRFGVLAVIAVTLACVDQISKVFARAVLPSVTVRVIPNVLNFELVYNSGAAFGFGGGYGIAFVALAVLMVVGSIIYLVRAPLVSRCEVVGLALACGGAVGNSIDRVVYGVVTDFIATAFVDFPVFNIADIGITVGVVLALIGFLFLSPANEAAREEANADRAQHPDSAVEARRRRKRDARRARARRS